MNFSAGPSVCAKRQIHPAVAFLVDIHEPAMFLWEDLNFRPGNVSDLKSSMWLEPLNIVWSKLQTSKNFSVIRFWWGENGKLDIAAATFSLQWMANSLKFWMTSLPRVVTWLRATYPCSARNIFWSETTASLNATPWMLCPVQPQLSFNRNWCLAPPMLLYISEDWWECC